MFLDDNTALPNILSMNVTQGPTLSLLELVLIIVVCLVLGVVTLVDNTQVVANSVKETIRGGQRGGGCGCDKWPKLPGFLSRRKK